VVLDTGALIAVDRRDRRVGAMLRVLQRERTPVRTSAGAVAQVWRDGRRQANLARTLTGVEVVSLDHSAARRVGELLAHASSTDIVDAHVAVLVAPGGRLLTSDDEDLRLLLSARKVPATVVHV
jgi:hypothetical protein